MSTVKGNVQFPKQDIYERVNFLYQAAHVVGNNGSGGSQAAQFYGKTLASIARKGVLKLDPSIKQSLCKHCHTLLIPGVTSSLRLRAKRETHFVGTCLTCKSKKRYLCRPGYQLWYDKLEALVENQEKLKKPAKVLPYKISASPVKKISGAGSNEGREIPKQTTSIESSTPETLVDDAAIPTTV